VTDSAPAAPADRSARLGALIAGAGGVLLAVALFVPWYTFPGSELAGGAVGEVLEDVGGSIGIDVRDAVSSTGWESFEFTDLLCALAAAVAIARAGIVIVGGDDDPPIPGAVLTLGLGIAALLPVIYRILNPPGIGQNRELGIWLAVLGVAAIVYGSYTAMQASRG
jgi:hypothetical protein